MSTKNEENIWSTQSNVGLTQSTQQQPGKKQDETLASGNKNSVMVKIEKMDKCTYCRVKIEMPVNNLCKNSSVIQCHC